MAYDELVSILSVENPRIHALSEVQNDISLLPSAST